MTISIQFAGDFGQSECAVVQAILYRQPHGFRKIRCLFLVLLSQHSTIASQYRSPRFSRH